MPSMREQVLSVLCGQLQAVSHTVVKRNEALPSSVPAGGLVILRDGDPGEPDVTLNPRSEFYAHRAEIEAFVTQPADGGGEADLDTLVERIGSALRADPDLGGKAENLTLSAPAVEVEVVEGAVPILTARLSVVVDYVVN